MMNYEIFKEVVKEKFMDQLAPELQSGVVEIREVNKVNRTLDALSVRQEGENVSPNIYLNGLYEEYLESEDLQAVISNAAARYEEAVSHKPEVVPEMNMDNLKDNVIMVLANTEQNKEMLQNIPSRAFQDLSVIFRWVVSQDKNGIASTIVTNDMAIQAGLSSEDLFKAAVDNTRKMMPPKVISMDEMMKEMMISDGIPPEMLAVMGLETARDPKESMWVITNEKGINGAASMRCYIYHLELNWFLKAV